jgi:hypothetical protein
MDVHKFRRWEDYYVGALVFVLLSAAVWMFFIYVFFSVN